MPFTAEQIARQGLSSAEFERICALLGREPNGTELAIFGVMWSEHCSYKSSRLLLKQLPTEGAVVLQGPGENAGAIAAGDGWACVFKIESHNHPSYVEPFQGAATGMGGILRDIFTMGARPVAVMDSLRFGPLRGGSAAARNRAIFDGVVGGIGHYGNCFGVANLGGETVFDAVYNGNPLVNALALGLAREDQLFYGRASGAGNPVIYAGAKTGRDGIHGATMASEEFTAASEAKRPNVQVGDPFMERLLLEACLEAMASGAVVGIQDMGAAGLTSSSCEMGGRAGTGIELDLDRVPQREAAMTAEEMMLSESQERMLLVAAAGREEEVFSVFRKWGLDAAVVGRVTEGGRLRVFQHGECVADIPNAALTDQAPRYRRPAQAPRGNEGRETRGGGLGTGKGADAGSTGAQARRLRPLRGGAEALGEALLRLLASPNIGSAALIYEQYDTTIGAATLTAPGAGAGVLRLPGGRRALAMALAGPGRYCRFDPRKGAQLGVAAAARAVACTGAQPAAATNCLNLGNPEKPAVMWQLEEVIAGMAEACRALGTPVTGGNVSLYNETLGRGIDPTPVIGMVGLLNLAPHRREWRPPAGNFRAAGRAVLLLDAGVEAERAAAERWLGTGEYAAAVLGAGWGEPPGLDLEREKRLHQMLVRAVEEDLLDSAQPVSRGGLAVCLARCALARPVTEPSQAALGVSAAWPAQLAGEWAGEAELALFTEMPGWVVVSCAGAAVADIERLAAGQGIGCWVLGSTGGGRFQMAGPGWRLDVRLEEMAAAWHGALPAALGEDSLGKEREVCA